MKTSIIAACALAAASVILVQMTDSADARSRKGMTVKRGGMGMNNTGGRNASPSAVGGNAAQPSRPGAQGSGGGGNSSN